MLNRDFERFLEYFSRHGIGCAVETNGTLIEGERLEAIGRYRAYCAISLDGADEDIHNVQRGQTDAFSRTIRGIDSLEARGVRFQLIMSLSRLNRDDLEPLVSRVVKEWPHCDLLKLNIVHPEGRGRDMGAQGLLFSPVEVLATLVADVGLLVDKYPLRIGLHANPAFFTPLQLRKRYGFGGGCGYHHALSLLANGSVSICSMGKVVPDFVLGHAADIELADVWMTSPLLCGLRESPQKQLKGVCSRCILRKRCFGGCRAAALIETGDFFGPSPSCQALFDAGAFPSQWLRPEPPRPQRTWRSGQGAVCERR